MRIFTASCLSALLLSAISTSVQGQQHPLPTEQSCQRFVQQFYDWYVPIAVKDHAGPASDIALKRRVSAFNPSLFQQLKRESEIQAKVNDAGLDFDPFLNSQDPSPLFRVTKVSQKGNECWAEVHGFLEEKAAEKVTPELSFIEGQWKFVNFHYVESDLLQLLRSLRSREPK